MGALSHIVEAARSLRAENPDCPLLLATVVKVDGPSGLRVGGRLLIAENRWIDDGWIGDRSGAAGVRARSPEEEILRQAWWFTRDGVPALLRHAATGTEIDWRLGLGDGGQVDLLVVPCDIDDPYDPLAFFETCLRTEKPGAVVTVLRSVGGRPSLGTRLQIGPDGVLRSEIGDARLAEVFADRARKVRASGRSEIYEDGSMEGLIEAVVPPGLDLAGFDGRVAGVGPGGLQESQSKRLPERIKTIG
jgi:xanthine/CO dehydrogenase XdhC/CoxF family maturation factor